MLCIISPSHDIRYLANWQITYSTCSFPNDLCIRQLSRANLWQDAGKKKIKRSHIMSNRKFIESKYHISRLTGISLAIWYSKTRSNNNNKITHIEHCKFLVLLWIRISRWNQSHPTCFLQKKNSPICDRHTHYQKGWDLE